jgi:hypothetical protein
MIIKMSGCQEASVTSRSHTLLPSVVLAAMRILKPAAGFLAVLALLLSAIGAAGQGTFQDLNFERATLTNYSPGSIQVQVSDALPNWSAYLFNGQTLPQTYVWYDGLSLGGAAISVVDGKWPGGVYPSLTPIQGSFSLLLFGGGMGNDVSSIISQTGLVPSGTMSLQVKMSWFYAAPVITLGGQTVSMVPLATFPSYTLYGSDVSPLAGQVATLSITEPPPAYGLIPPSYVFLDDIRFVTIPEPNVFALSALGALLIGRSVKGRQL